MIEQVGYGEYEQAHIILSENNQKAYSNMKKKAQENENNRIFKHKSSKSLNTEVLMRQTNGFR